MIEGHEIIAGANGISGANGAAGDGNEEGPGAASADPGGGPAARRGGVAALVLDPMAKEELRRRFETTTESVRAIAGAFALSAGSLGRYAKLEGWRRPDGAPGRTGGVARGSRRLATSLEEADAVAGRLIRAVDRQLARIEAAVRKADAGIAEKDARILGHLARTLSLLMALERDDGAPANEAEPVDRDELNADLAGRIARWASGGEGPA